jgi:glycosyltransferase involved in cell wall biosynthesis
MLAMNSHYVIEPPVARTPREARMRRVQRFLFCCGYRRIARTAYVSQQMADLGRRFVGRHPAKHTVIYEGVSQRLIEYLRTHPAPAPAQPPYLLAVGSLSGHKNYPGMLASFAQVVAGWAEPLRLKIAGSFGELRDYQSGRGPKPALLAQAEALGIADRVDFLGFVADDDLYALLAGATAFVSTSLLEAFNLTSVEAMAAGLPLVVPNTSSFPEQCGDAALYHDPTDPRGAAQQVLRLLREPPLRAAYAARARGRGQRYTWPVVAHRYLAELADITGIKRRRSASAASVAASRAAAIMPTERGARAAEGRG